MTALFGLTVRAQPLGSQQDSNFLLAEPAGAVAGVLKIANPAFSAAEIEAQDGAAAHIARACEDLRVATVTHGPVTVPVDEGAALARVLRYLPGGTLAGAGRYLSPRGPGWRRGSRTGWPRPCWPRGMTPWPPGSARHG